MSGLIQAAPCKGVAATLYFPSMSSQPPSSSAPARSDAIDLTAVLARYRRGEWRTPIFRDLVLADVDRLDPEVPSTLLDIGCGAGFDSDAASQAALAARCHTYVGIEPDLDININPVVTVVHRCTLEEAPVTPDSIDVAFSVMVVEHLEHPQRFWDAAYRALKPGGVCWAFSVDARHPFVPLSLLLERLRIKDLYLDWLLGKRGQQRYENYPVFYRSNSERAARRLTKNFRDVQVINFRRMGQLDDYLPRKLRWIARVYDRFALLTGLPGIHLAIRAQK